MTKVTSGEFTREFGRYRALAQREPLVITHHGRDDLVLLAVDDFVRLLRNEPVAMHVSQTPHDIIDELGKWPAPKAVSKFDDEMQIRRIREQRKVAAKKPRTR